MKKFMSKAFAIIMSATLIFSITACGSSNSNSSSSEATTQEAAESSTGSNATIANPVIEVGEDEMVEQTGIDLPAPEGASDVRYSIIQEEDLCTAQLDFTLDGKKFYLRAESTDLASLIPRDADGNLVDEKDIDYSAGDLSGLYYNWTESGSSTVKECEALYNVSKEGPGYIAWLDGNAGILYNLCMEENADSATLQSYAEKIYVPVQSDFITDESSTEQ